MHKGVISLFLSCCTLVSCFINHYSQTPAPAPSPRSLASRLPSGTVTPDGTKVSDASLTASVSNDISSTGSIAGFRKALAFSTPGSDLFAGAMTTSIPVDCHQRDSLPN